MMLVKVLIYKDLYELDSRVHDVQITRESPNYRIG